MVDYQVGISEFYILDGVKTLTRGPESTFGMPSCFQQ